MKLVEGGGCVIKRLLSILVQEIKNPSLPVLYLEHMHVLGGLMQCCYAKAIKYSVIMRGGGGGSRLATILDFSLFLSRCPWFTS